MDGMSVYFIHNTRGLPGGSPHSLVFTGFSEEGRSFFLPIFGRLTTVWRQLPKKTSERKRSFRIYIASSPLNTAANKRRKGGQKVPKIRDFNRVTEVLQYWLHKSQSAGRKREETLCRKGRAHLPSKGLQDIRQDLLAVQRSVGAVLRGMQNHQSQPKTACLLSP